MSKKNQKKIGKHIDQMIAQYGFNSYEWVEKDNYPALQFDEVRVYRIPITSGTELKHVAQNALKAARAARKMNNGQPCTTVYGGGKK